MGRGAGREAGPGQTHRALSLQLPRVENHPDRGNPQHSHPRPHRAPAELRGSRLLAMTPSAGLIAATSEELEDRKQRHRGKGHVIRKCS